MRTRTRGAPLEQRRARSRERGLDLLARLGGRGDDLVDAPRGVQQVLPHELVLRIERRVPVGQDAESDAKRLRIAAQQLTDLIVAPDVERALHLVRGAGSSRRGFIVGPHPAYVL